jgi:hypothetical protein
MKYDFSKVPIKDIEGNVQEANYASTLSQILYYQSPDMDIHVLGLDMHKSSEVEISKQLKAKLLKFLNEFNGMNYLAKSSIIEMLKTKKVEANQEVEVTEDVK